MLFGIAKKFFSVYYNIAVLRGELALPRPEAKAGRRACCEE